MSFDRIAQKSLITWKNKKGRKPLVLQGARQVGKTFLLKEFGKSEFKNIAYFNFEERQELKSFFESTKKIDRIIENLSLVHGEKIEPEVTLIILDEIQECNAALNTLKYFCENAPEYAVIAAGSLLGITLGKSNSFPVGKVEFLNIYPLNFTEFLSEADPILANYISQFDTIEKIPEIFFSNLREKFRNYFISGGMPEAAKTLLNLKSIEETQHVLRDILHAYQLDFSKHAPTKDIGRIGYVWNSVPGQLAKENKKFLYQVVKSGARAREYEESLLWLIQAGLVYKVNQCKKPHIPLSAYDDLLAFKIYTVDIGLLRCLAQLEPTVFLTKNSLFTEFNGALSENYILQSLSIQFDVPLRYWTSEGKAEVDFLIQYKNEIIPCEVKASDNTNSKSLTIYNQKYDPKVRIRFSMKNLSFDGGLLNIPLFMADKTRLLLDLIL